MVSLCLPSLSDLCSIRLGYLLCIRSLVGDYDHTIDEFFNENEVAALAAAQGLPLPERLKCLVVMYVKTTGGRLFSLLSLWFSKLPTDTPQKWCIGNMLFDCLILDAYGLINHRRTAQTLLSNKILHNPLAFQLACINFLETEVLKLWILVKDYFLNKIVCEGNESFALLLDVYGAGPIPEDKLEAYFTEITEPEEVLFWIAYCLSREKAVDIAEVPHFMGTENDWYEYAWGEAACSGNVACFGYLKNFRDRPFRYDYLHTTKRILRNRENCQQSSFIFHFNLLNHQEKLELFLGNWQRQMVRQFLQWPMSLTFFLNTEEVWNLIPEGFKDMVLLDVFRHLANENVVMQKVDIPHPYPSLTYCDEHILQIWHALWKISAFIHKLFFLELHIFLDFQGFDGDEFPSRFETSGLKQKLLSLCLSNSSAVLELHQKETLQESLRSVVAEHMPEDLQDIERGFLSFFETLRTPLIRCRRHRGTIPALEEMQNYGTAVFGRYLYYIKAVEFSSHRI